MLPKPQYDTICAAIITYYPDGDFSARVDQIVRQVDAVVIIDNHSDSRTRELLTTLAARPRISLVSNTVNLGIATALNQGAQWAFERGYSYLLAFDQDTVVLENMVDVYAEIYSEISALEVSPKETVAIIGANFVQSVDGRTGKKIKPKTIPSGSSGAWAEAIAVLTSGTLLPRTVWEKIGPFRDEFFIDGVDEEYCLRARTQGVRVVISTEPLMEHSIGEQSRYWFLGQQGWTYNYSPLRHYCRTRNSVAVWRTFFRHEPRWVIGNLLFNLKIFVKICLYERQKSQKLRGMGLGLWDGIRGRFDLLNVRIP